MTDRFNALIVTLEEPIRSDDAEQLMTAIRQLRGVLTVAGNVADVNDYIAYARARADLQKRLFDALHDPTKP